MKKSRLFILALVAQSPSISFAQGIVTPPKTTDVDAAFEVATIKPSTPEERLSIVARGRQLVTTASSMIDLIAFGYGVHARQVVAGPPWLESDKYDLTAQRSSENSINGQQLRVMVQNLLAERFGFTFHRDKKELSVFAVVLGKTGPKFTDIATYPNGTPGVGFNGPGSMTVRNATISDFAGFMQRYVLDRPVVDRTDFPGRYNFNLKWTPDESQFQGRAVDPAAKVDDDASLFTAIQEQLGLKLESTRLLIDVLVVDRVERPSAN